jgi:PAS domain S-box-containing protein
MSAGPDLTIAESDLMQSFADSCDEILYLKDEEGRFIMVNRRAAESANLSKEELLGKTAYDIVPREEADRLTEVDRKVARTGTPMSIKNTFSLPSGRVTLVDHKFPVKAEGYPRAVGGIAVKTTASDEQKAMSRRALEMWSSDTALAPESVYTSTYVNHQEPDVRGGVSAKRLQAWKQLVSSFRAAFPRAKMRILTQMAEDDRVATQWEMTATQSGEFEGFPATNKKATWTGVCIDRFENGKIAETWVAWDKYRFLHELGLIP